METMLIIRDIFDCIKADTYIMHFVAKGRGICRDENRGNIFGNIMVIKKYIIKNDEASTPRGYANELKNERFIASLFFWYSEIIWQARSNIPALYEDTSIVHATESIYFFLYITSKESVIERPFSREDSTSRIVLFSFTLLILLVHNCKALIISNEEDKYRDKYLKNK